MALNPQKHVFRESRRAEGGGTTALGLGVSLPLDSTTHCPNLDILILRLI